MVIRRPTKNRQKKVIDDEDEDGDEGEAAAHAEESKTPKKNMDTTDARRTTAMHSEVTSSRGIIGGKEDDGSVKSLKRQKVDEVKAFTPKVSPSKKPEDKKVASPQKKPAVP